MFVVGELAVTVAATEGIMERGTGLMAFLLSPSFFLF